MSSEQGTTLAGMRASASAASLRNSASKNNCHDNEEAA